MSYKIKMIMWIISHYVYGQSISDKFTFINKIIFLDIWKDVISCHQMLSNYGIYKGSLYCMLCQFYMHSFQNKNEHMDVKVVCLWLKFLL